jgi:hypothetical protein
VPSGRLVRGRKAESLARSGWTPFTVAVEHLSTWLVESQRKRAPAGICASMEEHPTTQELQVRQLDRERTERGRSDEAVSEEAAEARARRAEKSAFLRRRLEERAKAERDLARKRAS